jgi:hypothetical protein
MPRKVNLSWDAKALDPGGVSWYVIQTTTDEEREFVYQTLNRFWIEQFPQAAEHFGMTEKG